MLGKDTPEEGPQNPVVQVGIHSWYWWKCYNRRFPNVFTRISKVADWVQYTVCERTGELCKRSQTGKSSKSKKRYEDNCVKVPTAAPTEFTTDEPTVTAQPITPMPSYMPTTFWPTWLPTTDSKLLFTTRFSLMHVLNTYSTL